MLKDDKQRIEQLVSSDEQTRVFAARELESLERGYFLRHPFSPTFLKQRKEQLVAAYHASPDPLVRAWVAQLLAVAMVARPEADLIIANELAVDLKLAPSVLAYIYDRLTIGRSKAFSSSKEAIKGLHQHPDHEVRWRCALLLEHLSLDYDEDIAVIRKLLTDDCDSARTYAVLALKKLGPLRAADRKVLEQVVAIDRGAARTYAKEILGG